MRLLDRMPNRKRQSFVLVGTGAPALCHTGAPRTMSFYRDCSEVALIQGWENVRETIEQRCSFRLAASEQPYIYTPFSYLICFFLAKMSKAFVSYPHSSYCFCKSGESVSFSSFINCFKSYHSIVLTKYAPASQRGQKAGPPR